LRAVLETPGGAATISRYSLEEGQTPLDVLNLHTNPNSFQRALVSMRETRKRQETIRQEIESMQQQKIEEPTTHEEEQQDKGQKTHELDNSVDAERREELNDGGEDSNMEQDASSGSNRSNNNNHNRSAVTAAPNMARDLKRKIAMIHRNELMIASFQQNEYWQKAAMLILVEYTRQPLSLSGLHDDHANIVHACAGTNNCPTSLLEFAMLLHHDDLINKRDSKGRLPLHVAVANHAMTLLERDCNNDGNDKTTTKRRRKESHWRRLTTRTLRTLLEVCPQAAFVPDADDNLPLAVALQVIRQEGRDARPNAVWSPGLQRVLDANLAALETLNLDERLYPHVWAKRMTSIDDLFHSIRGHPDLFQIKPL